MVFMVAYILDFLDEIFFTGNIWMQDFQIRIFLLYFSQKLKCLFIDFERSIGNFFAFNKKEMSQVLGSLKRRI